MRFIQQSTFSVKWDKVEELQRWVIDNQRRLADSYPQGTSLLGMFVTVYGSSPSQGDFHLLEQLDSYAALDRLAAESKNPNSEFRRLSMECMKFFDFSRGAPTSQTLLKDMVDATVMDIPVEQAREAVNA